MYRWKLQIVQIIGKFIYIYVKNLVEQFNKSYYTYFDGL